MTESKIVSGDSILLLSVVIPAKVVFKIISSFLIIPSTRFSCPVSFDKDKKYKGNTSAFDDVDLVPNVLTGVGDVDLSTTIFDKKIDLPFYCAPTALQRLFHYDGERAVGKAAQKFNTMFGVSALATVSVEEIASLIDTPKMFQFYFHKDRGLNDSCSVSYTHLTLQTKA